VSNNTLQLTCPSDAGLPPITVYQQYPENVTIASAQEIETCEEQCPGGTSGLTVSPAAPLARSSLLAGAAAVAAAGLARGGVPCLSIPWSGRRRAVGPARVYSSCA